MQKISLNLRPKNAKKQSSTQSSERKIAFYIRVSTEEQAENPEGSVKNQEERLSLTLKLKNSERTFGRLVGVYCDAGKSGKDLNRPEMQRLLHDIHDGKVTMVMVSELSRLSRSMKDFSEIWEFMQAHGCGFLSLRENFDTSTAAGEMMLYVIANFAQFERRQTSERVAANFEARAKRGLYNGGCLPIGYELDPGRRGALRVHDEEAKLVQTAFQALIDHGSVTLAAKELNRRGYLYGTELRCGGGLPRTKNFTFGGLQRLLSNKAYIGIRRFKTKAGWQEVQAMWPSIVSSETFELAQKILGDESKKKVGLYKVHPYMLSGRVYCGECGSILIGKSAHGQHTKVPYYDHGSLIRREHTLEKKSYNCKPFRVPATKLEARVWEEVVAILRSPSQRTQILDGIRKLEKANPQGRAIQRKEMELTLIGEKIANLTQRITELPKGVPADSFYEELRKQGEKKAAVQEALDELARNTGQSLPVTEERYERLLHSLKRASEGKLAIESKRKIVQALVHKIVVLREGFRLHFYAGEHEVRLGEAWASPLKPRIGKKSVQVRLLG